MFTYVYNRDIDASMYFAWLATICITLVLTYLQQEMNEPWLKAGDLSMLLSMQTLLMMLQQYQPDVDAMYGVAQGEGIGMSQPFEHPVAVIDE